MNPLFVLDAITPTAFSRIACSISWILEMNRSSKAYFRTSIRFESIIP